MTDQKAENLTERDELAEKWVRVVEIFLEALDARKTGFAGAVVMSGMDSRQLRNGLERRSLRVGQKLEHVGRWEFTIRDCLYLLVTSELSSRTWMPVSAAAEVAELVAKSANVWLAMSRDFYAQGAGQTIVELIAFADEGRPSVLIHCRGGDWGFYSLDGHRLENGSFLEAHARLPIMGLVTRLAESWGDIETELAATS